MTKQSTQISDKEIRQLLIDKGIFKGDDEKLVLASMVIESSSASTTTTASSQQNSSSLKKQISNINDDDDDNSATGKKRIICISFKKAKLRIVKLKEDASSIIKAWNLEDVKSLEMKENPNQIAITLQKPYLWTFDEKGKRTNFLYTLVKMTKDAKKVPKYINFDAEMIQEQMVALIAEENAVKAKKPEDEADTEDYLPLNEEFEEDMPNSELLSVDLGVILSDFNWSASADAADLEASLVSELQALEAANVHDIIQSEEQANAVVSQIGKTLQELSQITNWLSHYTGLLENMGNDVHQIEAQNKGIQVTTNNQKLLLTELESFISSLRVPAFVLEVLQNEELDTPDGVRECEKAIDRVMGVIRYKNDDLRDMVAVKERIAFLQSHANTFAIRLSDYLSNFFAIQAKNYLSDNTRASQRNALKLVGHETTEAKLFKFKKLLGWLKDVDARKHYDLQMAYVRELSRTYRSEIGDFFDILRNLYVQKKAEETDFLFASVGNNVTIAASNALKNAIAVTTEKAGGGMRIDLFKKKDKKKEAAAKDDDDDEEESSYSVDGQEDSRMNPDDAMNHALLKLTNIMIREQNFVMDFFGIVKHAAAVVVTGSSNPDLTNVGVDGDGAEALETWQSNLSIPRQQFKDPKAEKRINELMESLFEGVRDMFSALIDSGLKFDQSFAVGMMAHIEYHSREYQKTCHAYPLALLEHLSRKVNLIFEKFVVDQIKAIEDTRVSLKKRTGILSFVKTFPKFVDRVEKMLSTWDGSSRKLVDKAYARIIKSMFDTLEAEAQQTATTETKNKDDEKDSLNKHILIVENMHHFHSEIRAKKVPSLEGFVKQAKTLYDINLEAYGKVVIRKPLGKLLEFFEGIEGLLKTGPADEVSYHVQFSKSSLKEVIKKYPGREIKKSLEVLYKRVDKHFTEEEGLLQVVWRSIQEEFCRQLRKYEELITKCYPDVTMRLDFTLEELLGYFSELAQAH